MIWSEEVKQECLKLRVSGATFNQIEQEKGVPSRTVRSWLGSSAGQKIWSDEVKEECLRLRREGLGYKQITKLTHVPDSTQRDWYPPELKSFQGRNRSISPQIVPLEDKKMLYKGLRYKLGARNKLYYEDELGTWLRSTLEPQDVGLAALS
jgi:transposase-like protein